MDSDDLFRRWYDAGTQRYHEQRIASQAHADSVAARESDEANRVAYEELRDAFIAGAQSQRAGNRIAIWTLIAALATLMVAVVGLVIALVK